MINKIENEITKLKRYLEQNETEAKDIKAKLNEIIFHLDSRSLTSTEFELRLLHQSLVDAITRKTQLEIKLQTYLNLKDMYESTKE